MNDIADKYLLQLETENLFEIKSLKDISIDEANQLKPLWDKFKKETSKSSYFKYKDSPYQKWISQFKKGKVKILLAIDDNKSIGFIIGQIKEDSEKYLSAYIGAIYLEPEYRSKGIANDMFKAIMDWFKESNKSIVRLKTIGSNVGAQKFYKKMGFIPEIITMRNKDSKGL